MRRVLVGIAILLWSGMAAAHGVEMFAYAEGEAIHGSVYFVDGTPAAGAEVTVYGPDDEVRSRLEADEAGEFVHRMAQSGDFSLVAKTADGHRAAYELTGTAPDDADNSASKETDGSSGEGHQGDASDRGGGGDALDREATRALVREAVAEEVGPLRQELHAYAHRVRVGDILGGIGVIIGLAGAVMAWRARQRERRWRSSA